MRDLYIAPVDHLYFWWYWWLPGLSRWRLSFDVSIYSTKGFTHFVEISYGTRLSNLTGQFRILFILAQNRVRFKVTDVLSHAQHITNFGEIRHAKYLCNLIVLLFGLTDILYRVYREESAIHRENIPQVKLDHSTK